VGGMAEADRGSGTNVRLIHHVAGKRRGLIYFECATSVTVMSLCTLKVYSSEKEATGDGSWQNSEIVLKPLNPNFDPIVLTAKDEGEVRAIAALVGAMGES
jgi:hypothetical protein